MCILLSTRNSQLLPVSLDHSLNFLSLLSRLLSILATCRSVCSKNLLDEQIYTLPSIETLQWDRISQEGIVDCYSHAPNFSIASPSCGPIWDCDNQHSHLHWWAWNILDKAKRLAINAFDCSAVLPPRFVLAVGIYSRDLIPINTIVLSLRRVSYKVKWVQSTYLGWGAKVPIFLVRIN